MNEELNVYYYPEKHDLEQVASFEYSSGCYEFDTRVIWKHKKTGELYTARDSGCSCPTPFESYTDIKDLEKFSIGKIEEELKEGGRSDYYDGEPISQCLEKLRSL